MTPQPDRAPGLSHAPAKPGAGEDSPWEDAAVAKVHDQIFAFFGAGGARGAAGVGE